MSSAQKFLPSYTINDYQHWEGDWELIEGIAVSMSPSPFGPHERTVAEIARSIGNSLDEQGTDCRVYAGLDWIISDDTVVRPDVMVVCGDQPEKHLEKAPIIVVEVLSASTRKLDIGSKRRIYGEAGVQIYLIVDVEKKTIEINDFDSDPVVVSDGIASFSANDMSFEVPLQNVFR